MILNYYRYFIICFIILCSFSWGAADDNNPSSLKPDPKLSPADVVSVQMNALKNNNTPYRDAGIELSFRFASPQNKKSTGPLDRFKLLFKNKDYAPMLNHDSLEIGPVNYSEDGADVPIFIISKEGEKVLYLFRLHKQNQKPYENCWMTSGVIRVPTDTPENSRGQPI